jgi:hypothetical protein
MYFVSRQQYWPDGKLCVEVVSGGLDYANPDMLGAKYPRLGEGKEYIDPVEAVEAAITICKQWRVDTHSRKPYVGVGSTMGFTLPFDEGTFRDARAWAKKARERLSKCDCCGEILPKDYFWPLEYDHDIKCCSEYCCEKIQEAEYKANKKVWLAKRD